MDYIPASNRYEHIPYRRCGKSGILLPALSLEELAEIEAILAEG